jgi:hypothetical protein
VLGVVATGDRLRDRAHLGGLDAEPFPFEAADDLTDESRR